MRTATSRTAGTWTGTLGTLLADSELINISALNPVGAPSPEGRKQNYFCKGIFAGVSDQPAVRPVSEVDTLKALASPIRRKILRYLDDHGQATSTTVAAALGESTGTTSYHLRLLARHSLIEEAGATDGRERWWRKAPLDLRFPVLDEHVTGDERLVHAELHRQRITEDLATIAALRDAVTPADEKWIRLARTGIRLSGGQLDAFCAEYMDMIRRYAIPADAAAPDSALLQLRLYIFPERGASADR